MSGLHYSDCNTSCRNASTTDFCPCCKSAWVRRSRGKIRYIQVAKKFCNSRRETTEKVALRYGESTKHRHKLCSSFLETPQVSPSHERVTGGAYQEAQLAGPFSGGGWWGCLFLSAFVCEGEGREEWRGPDGLDVRRSTLDARGDARGSVLGARRSHCRLERFQLCIAKLG